MSIEQRGSCGTGVDTDEQDEQDDVHSKDMKE